MFSLGKGWKSIIFYIYVIIFSLSSLAYAEGLHEAVKEGDLDEVKRLIEEGANIEAKDASSATPLYNAVDRGHKELAELLILKGANVNANCTDGMTPLHRAVTLFGGDIELTKLLISKGANVNAVDKTGHTPLWWAESGGDLLTF